jgi:hypothetical protein
MELSIDISEKDLISFGWESIQKEINNTLKWMRIRQSFRKISEKLKSSYDDEEDYFRVLEEIRESAWNEYKKEISFI